MLKEGPKRDIDSERVLCLWHEHGLLISMDTDPRIGYSLTDQEVSHLEEHTILAPANRVMQTDFEVGLRTINSK